MMRSLDDRARVLALHILGNRVGQIAKATGIPRPTVHRWVNSSWARDYVAKVWRDVAANRYETEHP